MREEEIDYKNLLNKYMRHVLDDSGMTFCDFMNQSYQVVVFTPLEKAALKNMADEIDP